MQSRHQIDNNFAADIDDFDRHLLFELDKDCRQSTGQLAGRLGKSRQTVEYRIKRLQESKVLLGFNATFNTSKMGYHLYKFQLKLRDFPEETERLINYLNQSGRTYWVGRSSGTWDLLFSVFYQRKKELIEIMNDLTLKFPRNIVEITGHPIVEIQQFPKMYLTRQIEAPREHTGEEVFDSELDAIDYGLIAELVRNARASIKQLAETLGVAPNIVRRKMQRLEESGVIVQYRISVDHRLLGFDFYKVIFGLNGYTADEHDRFYAYISNIPEVQFYVRNFWSVELELMANSFEYYQSLIDDLKRAFPRMLGEYDTVLLSTDEWNSAFTDHLRSQEPLYLT